MSQNSLQWIDVHTHINMIDFDAPEVLRLAREAGVERMITIGTGHDDLQKVVDACDRLAPIVYGTLGFHPHDAKTYDAAGEKFIRDHVKNPRIVGIGEIGLDYYYNHSDHDIQKKVFAQQLDMAAEYNLPIEIHTREAEADTYDILKAYKGKVRGLFHCFTSSMDLAMKGLDLGYNISISGVVTFKKSDALKEVVKAVPLDRLHIETDAPFLTPEPFRGRKNHPALMVHTAQVVADLKGVSLEALAEQTNKNAKNLFTKIEWS
ncbi:MAG: TatD family hydrolase [Bdellovibrionota bacterium]